MNDAVVDVLGLQKGGDGAVEPNPVDGVQVVVVAQGLALLGVDVLAQSGGEIGGLQVVGGQGVARQHRMDISAPDQPGKGVPGVVVEGEGGAHDPHHLAVVLFVAQQLIELVVVPGKGRLPGPTLAEGKDVPAAVLALAEAVGVDQNALLPLLRAAHGHQFSLFQAAELPHVDPRPGPHRHAVHAALLCQMPLGADLEVLRENAHGVIALRGHPVGRGGHQTHLRRRQEDGVGEVGGRVGTQLEGHRKASFFDPGRQAREVVDRERKRPKGRPFSSQHTRWRSPPQPPALFLVNPRQAV